MPRRKPDKVIEERRSLGSYERQLEQDKITVEGMKAVAIAVSGIATGIGGLGIGGGLLLGAIFWKDEIAEIIDVIDDVLPNTEGDGIAEWFSSWGAEPVDIVGEEGTKTENTFVDQLVNSDGETLAGQSPYHAYSNGAAGRQAEYDHRVAVATEQYTAAQLANWLNYPTNQPPPNFLLLDEWSIQVALRETGRMRSLSRFVILTQWLTGTSDPKKMNGYQYDPMLDWSAYATYGHKYGGLGYSSEDYRLIQRGKELIEFFMNWSAPLPFNPPMDWTPNPDAVGLH